MKKILIVIILSTMISILSNCATADEELKELKITAPLDVNEGDCRLILVTDNETGDGVEGANISIDTMSNFEIASTDADGKCNFCGFVVENTTTYTITVCEMPCKELTN